MQMLFCMSTSISTRVHTFSKVLNDFRSVSACVFIEFTSQMIHRDGSHCIIMLDCSMSIDGYADIFKLKSSYQVSGGIFYAAHCMGAKRINCHNTPKPSPFLPPLPIHHRFHNNHNRYSSSTTIAP